MAYLFFLVISSPLAAAFGGLMYERTCQRWDNLPNWWHLGRKMKIVWPSVAVTFAFYIWSGFAIARLLELMK